MLRSPSTFSNLVVTGNLTFDSDGPNDLYPATNLIVVFDRPVIVTRLNVDDIDRSATGMHPWNDSFNFLGIAFSSANGSNCTATTTGASTTSTFFGAGSASWFCSGPVTTFSIDYFGNGSTLTTAALGYSIEIIPIPVMDTLCVNEPAPGFPEIGDGIDGSWDAEFIDTSTAGTFQYEFTPAEGQHLDCPVQLTVVVENCCLPTLTLQSPENNMTNNDLFSERQRQNWIQASNIIGVGNASVNDGVVYHAGNYVELREGFEAVHGAQFSADIEDCSHDYAYRQQPVVFTDMAPVVHGIGRAKPYRFGFLYDTDYDAVVVWLTDALLSSYSLLALDGKLLKEAKISETSEARLYIGDLPDGIYIISVRDANGEFYYDKIIKQ
jgi:hypothetical protein